MDPMKNKYAQVIIEITAKALDQPFTYKVEGPLLLEIKVGSVVSVPFGRSNRLIQGYVIELQDSTDLDPSIIKNIAKVHTKATIESEYIALAAWMKERYVCSFQSALNLMVPNKIDVEMKKEKQFHVNTNKWEVEAYFNQLKCTKTTQVRFDFLKKILDNYDYYTTPRPIEFYLEMGATQSTIKRLVEEQIFEASWLELGENPLKRYTAKESPILTNPAQSVAITAVNQAIENQKSDVFLLYGVTGSGKTEVYLQVIANVLNRGQQAIVLIPEIALTPQTIQRFIDRFGDVVGVMNSRLTQREKMDQWTKAQEGRVSIMIGPRSAIFAPFSNVGVIILDEEHETTYKSEQVPKYHAREVAIMRGNMGKFPVLLGSATPLLESYSKALEGKYILLELPDKAIESSNLSVHVQDMREELMHGNKSMLSQPLELAMMKALANKEQIILFLNRRGFAQFVSCRQCGFVYKCLKCDLPYTYHSDRKQLICHHCGDSLRMVENCPSCQSTYIKAFGIGTQKVERWINKKFPEARIVRMDLDTTSVKDGHQQLLEVFGNHEADILIGTQMVTKGLHFENVTVVGVLAADLSLYTSDFRAGERTFQIITQVTGRTGRGLKKGEAFIQTYSPDHYSIQCAKAQDYKRFYQQEIKYRQMMDYPPYSSILVLVFSGAEEKSLILDVRALSDIMAMIISELPEKMLINQEVSIIGPAPANLSKIKEMFRRRLMVKAKSHKLLTYLIKEFYNRVNASGKYQNIKMNFDINPMNAQ